MITVTLKNGYYIEIDPLNHTLRQKYAGKTKTGEKKEAYRTHGYFGSMEGALQRYVELACMDVIDGETLELKEYAATVDKAARIAVQGLENKLCGHIEGIENE